MSTLSVTNITGLGSLNIDANTFYIDTANNRVGIGTGAPTTTLTVNGAATFSDTVSVTGSLTAETVFAENFTPTVAQVTWDSTLDSYTDSGEGTRVTRIHENMRRCILQANGTVNYYLDPYDSTKKADGTSANIDGTDGYVMVEIPKFYFKYEKVGNNRIWKISDIALTGYTLHPAFNKNGVEVDYRYIGAYDACYWDATDSTYKSGLNLDDMTSNLDLTPTTGDKLASVSGVYPLVGVTRDECRTLAENNGTGWRQLDFWLASAVQMLYLVEYGSFNSQANLGNGNTNDAYVVSSSSQSDSPHGIAGLSNNLGNASTNSVTGRNNVTNPPTAFMSYRGIENFFGNCWNWVDGVNVNVSGETADGWHVTNTDTDFADNTATNHTRIATAMPADGFVVDIDDDGAAVGAFIPDDTSGGSSSTYLTDYFFDDDNNTNRVARLGGRASNGAYAGAFYWVVSDSSSGADRSIGARVCF